MKKMLTILIGFTILILNYFAYQIHLYSSLIAIVIGIVSMLIVNIIVLKK